MNKKFYLILLIFLFLNVVSSLEIGLSPSRVYLEGNINEKICTNFSLHSNKEINVIIKNKWSKKESRDIKNYNLSKEEFEVKIISSNKIIIEGEKEVEVCFIGEKKGNFYGAVLFESENRYVSVGSWVSLKINNNNFGITGNIISNFINSEKRNLFLLALIPEVIILFLLIKKLKFRKEKLV